jgi:quercetin dioxygenase-like cupin family protein
MSDEHEPGADVRAGAEPRADEPNRVGSGQFGPGGDDEVGASGGGEPRTGIPEDVVAAERAQADGEEVMHFLEVWNDYDPSMRFVVIFPLGEDQGATSGTVAYYIIEPGRHSGVHSDNAEEIVFVTEGEGEAFMMGRTQRLEAGKFAVFPPGLEHDIYAQGGTALRLLSFFPAAEIESTFQQLILPVGGNRLSSRPPRAVVTELDPDALPEGFPFDLAELGLEERPSAEGGLSRVQQMIGMTGPDDPMPPGVVITPGEGTDAGTDAGDEPTQGA